MRLNWSRCGYCNCMNQKGLRNPFVLIHGSTHGGYCADEREARETQTELFYYTYRRTCSGCLQILCFHSRPLFFHLLIDYRNPNNLYSSLNWWMALWAGDNNYVVEIIFVGSEGLCPCEKWHCWLVVWPSVGAWEQDHPSLTKPNPLFRLLEVGDFLRLVLQLVLLGPKNILAKVTAQVRCCRRNTCRCWRVCSRESEIGFWTRGQGYGSPELLQGLRIT